MNVLKKSLVLILSIIILFFGIFIKFFVVELKDWVSVENLFFLWLGVVLVLYDGVIYVFGGLFGSLEIYIFIKNNNIYKYLLKSNEWIEMSFMLFKWVVVEVIEVGGKIYVIGGYYDFGLILVMLKVVEIYDFKIDIWIIIINMFIVKVWLVVLYINGFIYVFGGGSFLGVVLNVVEKYDVIIG